MSKKAISILAICCMVFLFASCQIKRTPITAGTFKETMETSGYTVSDATDQFEVGVVESVSIAVKDEVQIEFYVMATDAKAESAFRENKDKFESQKGFSSTETSMTIGNYSVYKLNSDGKYSVVSRTANTFIYVSLPSEHKSEVDSALKDLGY